MNAELTSILTSAASLGQSIVGESFIGCDGVTYTGTFRAPNAFDLAAAGLEMQANGFPDKTIVALTATRSQFATPPLSWRRSKVPVVRLSSPAQSGAVASVGTDDPLFYMFILIVHQPLAPGS